MKDKSGYPLLPPWALSDAETLRVFGVKDGVGLATSEAERRHRRHGRNELRSIERRKPLAILVAQFRSAVVILLVAATGVSAAFGDYPEAAAIVTVIIINCAIGFWTELRAVRSMEALRQLSRVETRVLRDSAVKLLAAEELVPGDIVLLEGGDMITADLRLIEANRLEADESALTGESVPVAKQTEQLPEATPLAERSNLTFKGTAISRGSGRAVVIATGRETELGKISKLVDEAEAAETPLERRLDALARRLVWVTLAIAGAVAISGLWSGRELSLAIEVAIALAVAAIPEGLPIVATLALARGMWRMAKHKSLVARLSAVETLGATGVILTDKTGTLTENRMALSVVELDSGSVNVGDPEASGHEASVNALLEIACLCNNATLGIDSDGSRSDTGDPIEVAILSAGSTRGIHRRQLLGRFPELKEEPFDSERKVMATFHRGEQGQVLVAVKGAPEVVLEGCSMLRVATGDRPMSREQLSAWKERVNSVAAQGLKTLAVATKTVTSEHEDPYHALSLLGVLGFIDPPRAGVAEAIAACRAAGVRVVMVTGDHLATARTIAETLGLLAEDEVGGCIDASRLSPQTLVAHHEQVMGARVLARASPKQKLELITLHQEANNVVAMTGDGVNDAPALKKADIGVAMGIRGTQVAKEAAAMVLQDDNFSTIVSAIEQGRTIYANIRKFVIYLLSCNLSEVLVVGMASLVGGPLPLLPLQILFLNLVTDVFPALALGMGEGAKALMQQAPRRAHEPLITAGHWLLIGTHGLVIAITVLGTMALAMLWLGMAVSAAVTISFLTLAFAQTWHVFNMRAPGARWFSNEVTENRWVWGAVLVCVALILAAVLIPGLNTLLGIQTPGLEGWSLVVIMSVVPLALGPLVEAGVRRFSRSWDPDK